MAPQGCIRTPCWPRQEEPPVGFRQLIASDTTLAARENRCTLARTVGSNPTPSATRYHWIDGNFGQPISSNIPGPFRSVRQLALLAETIWCRLAEHEFRRAAATTIAIHRPEEVGAAQHLLGHRHPSTTRDYYILASNLQAAKAHQEALAGLRERAYPGTRRVRK